MAEWLAYPTELGDRPHEIELLQTLKADTPNGPCDLYVFRFRIRAPHWAADYGWMIGVAGPYLRSTQPTANSLGHTFSRLEPEGAMTIEEHVNQLIGTVDEWAAEMRSAGDTSEHSAMQEPVALVDTHEPRRQVRQRVGNRIGSWATASPIIAHSGPSARL